ncbi:hypothetical protein [Moraxella lacunata]|uniref:hypothetical protein n=1 Tax=Moraxella lacunata TaxID=477 RepID=UPI003EDEA89E
MLSSNIKIKASTKNATVMRANTGFCENILGSIARPFYVLMNIHKPKTQKAVREHRS